MKTNSELPISMLESYNTRLNDIDFVLFNLYKSNKEYRDYYKRLRVEEPDRLMIFDNSAYELYVKGEELDNNDFFNAILDLRPDIYIIPDKLMDHKTTIRNANIWSSYRDVLDKLGIIPMYVIQGDSSVTMEYCMNEYDRFLTGTYCIAIPFHNSFFKEYCKDEAIKETFIEQLGKYNDDIKYACGRVRWIWDHCEYLKTKPYIHILGSHCPFEKRFYNQFNFIKSMDTAYPVKCALANYNMFTEPEKPNIIIDDVVDKDISKKTKELIVYNIQKFKLI